MTVMKLGNITVAVTIIFTTLLLSGCSEEKKEAVAEIPPMKVETITVKKEKLPVWERFTAITKASSEQEVRARVSGRLEERYFNDGQMVKKGDKLFLIEQGPYKTALKAAEAGKARDEAALRLATANVNRYKPLVDEGLAPRAKYEEYLALQAQYKAAILADEANIEDARLKLSYTIVRAPISGRISARLVDVGNLVGYDSPTLLTTIMQIDPLYAYFSPSESAFAKIKHFASKIKLDAFSEVASSDSVLERERLDGYVDFADNTVDPQTSTVTMRAILRNPKASVLPGTFVYINVFVTDKYKFIMVPPQAVFEDQQGRFVYTVGKDSKAKRSSVETGFSGRYYTQIEKGLEEGERVVISGLAKIQPGMKLEPADVTKSKGIAAVAKEKKLIPEMGK